MDNISIVTTIFSISGVIFAFGSLLISLRKMKYFTALSDKHLHHHANITFKDGRILDLDIENLRNNSGEAEKIMDAFGVSFGNKR
jgi:hypothetical protein